MNGANFFQHTTCPILGIVSPLLMDPVEKRDSKLALVPTGLYALVLTPLNIIGVISGPYPFLRVHEQPWYISVVWLLGIFLVAYLVAVLLRMICGKKVPEVPVRC